MKENQIIFEILTILLAQEQHYPEIVSVIGSSILDYNMGQRAIGLIEQDDGKYDVHYTHWLPPEDISDRFSESKPLGDIFREEAIKENVSLQESKRIAMDHDAMTVVIIDSEYDVEITSRQDLV